MSGRTTTKRLNERRSGKTDWRRVDATTAKELERAIAADPDADIPKPDWTRARLVMAQRKESIHLRIDPDVLTWFRGKGHGYRSRMNAVLRAYMDAHRQQ